MVFQFLYDITAIRSFRRPFRRRYDTGKSHLRMLTTFYVHVYTLFIYSGEQNIYQQNNYTGGWKKNNDRTHGIQVSDLDPVLSPTLA